MSEGTDKALSEDGTSPTEDDATVYDVQNALDTSEIENIQDAKNDTKQGYKNDAGTNTAENYSDANTYLCDIDKPSSEDHTSDNFKIEGTILETPDPDF